MWKSVSKKGGLERKVFRKTGCLLIDALIELPTRSLLERMRTESSRMISEIETIAFAVGTG